jgi:hypothetical protein
MIPPFYERKEVIQYDSQLGQLATKTYEHFENAATFPVWRRVRILPP